MKQNISAEQLNELSNGGGEKLRKWWKPRWGDLYKSKYGEHVIEVEGQGNPALSGTEDDYGDDLPLLSIGQMIEFLGDDWYFEVFTANDIGDVLKSYDGELCDSLWEAVKEVLEK